jgi:hypothetical protein
VRYNLPKCRLTFKGLHGVISRKRALIMTTAVRKANSTRGMVFKVTWSYIPEKSTLHDHCCENSKQYRGNGVQGCAELYPRNQHPITTVVRIENSKRLNGVQDVPCLTPVMPASMAVRAFTCSVVAVLSLCMLCMPRKPPHGVMCTFRALPTHSRISA